MPFVATPSRFCQDTVQQMTFLLWTAATPPVRLLRISGALRKKKTRCLQWCFFHPPPPGFPLHPVGSSCLFFQTQRADKPVVLCRQFCTTFDTNVQHRLQQVSWNSSKIYEWPLPNESLYQSGLACFSVVEKFVDDAQYVVATQLQQEVHIVILVSIYMLTSHALLQPNVISNVFIKISQKDRGLVSFKSSQSVTNFIHRNKNPSQRCTKTHTRKLSRSKKWMIQTRSQDLLLSRQHSKKNNLHRKICRCDSVNYCKSLKMQHYLLVSSNLNAELVPSNLNAELVWSNLNAIRSVSNRKHKATP